MCPVKVSFNPPSAPAQHFAKSHIFMVLSAAPVTNHSLDASNALDLTQPKWPDTTAVSSHGACHFGLGILGGSLRIVSAFDRILVWKSCVTLLSSSAAAAGILLLLTSTNALLLVAVLLGLPSNEKLRVSLRI
jgi:hypothetical protein